MAVFAHFDIDDVVDDYVVFYLQQLSVLCCDIVFVSTSNLSDTEKDKISKYCITIICKENSGYDFMSYKVGLFSSGIDYTNYDELLLCNDSVYGPLFDLSAVFSEMEKNTCDFWGITQNKEIKPHLQSYFLVFSKSVISSGAITDFFSDLHGLDNKREIIQKYEIGLTSFLYERNFKFRSFIESASFLKRLTCFSNTIYHLNHSPINRKQWRISRAAKIIRNKVRNIKKYFLSIVIHNSINYTFFYWDYSLAQKSPFMKIALLRPRSQLVTSDSAVIRKIESCTDYPIDIILNHLQRTRYKYQKG